MKKIPDKSIDMILCDLPYGTTKCAWDIIIPFDLLWEQYKRIIKDKGCIALFGQEPFSSYLRLSNIDWYKYDWIWDKGKGSNPLLAKKRPMASFEKISIFNAGIYYPQMRVGKPYKAPRTGGAHTNSIIGNNKEQGDFRQKDNPGLYYPLSILPFSIHCGSKLHPTQKPVALLEYLIKTYTLEHELILDNTMGSGSTGVACINTNRDFIGIENDEKYFSIAQMRLEEEAAVFKFGIKE
jgi:site-specific DNA-methyltransferase (adenine-specific)